MIPPTGAAPVARGVAYWEDRAQRLGARAVVSTDHPVDGDLDAVTDTHRAILLPALAALLDGTERTVLDLGCGTGRLTGDLAALIGGDAIGVDPVAELLELAADDDATEYRQSAAGGPLPLDDDEVDVVFTLTVLGGLLEADDLAAMAAEIRRVLRPGGLLCLAESVSDPAAAVEHWAPRTADAYVAAFGWATLRPVARFVDAGDPITVLAGRAASSS